MNPYMIPLSIGLDRLHILFRSKGSFLDRGVIQPKHVQVKDNTVATNRHKLCVNIKMYFV